MHRRSVPILRVTFAVVFVWFGILKPLGISSAAPLVLATVKWMPVFAPEQWLVIIGWWEVAIGITFLFKKTTAVAIVLLYLQMTGTFLPLVLLPEVTFQEGIYYQPTLEGQYIIKDIMILAAALVIGGTTFTYDVVES